MTSSPVLYALTGATLFVIGLAAVILHAHLLRKIIGFNVMGSGTFLVLVGLGARGGLPDHVTQAMVLTGIVVAVAATALALALARGLLNLTGSMHLPRQGAPDD